MVEPSTLIPLSSTSSSSSSSDDNTFCTTISSSHQKPTPSKKRHGRPLGSKNKPKPPLMINQGREQSLKPIFIEVPNNSDVIEAVVQFARRYQVSITLLSASGSILSATLRRIHSHTSAFTVYGPFTLISLVGTYINNNSIASSSSLSLTSSSVDLRCSFRISFSSISGQSFIGVVGGKVVAANKVTLVVNTFKNFEIHKDGIDDGGEERDNNNLNACDLGGNLNISRFN
ncbi:AT-hook motif nuclear-localized protein 17 [Spatholobus suberectus]|nr:AT-hook motif nuclear-localized protein 17 [Spatholobus suberectus]